MQNEEREPRRTRSITKDFIGTLLRENFVVKIVNRTRY